MRTGIRALSATTTSNARTLKKIQVSSSLEQDQTVIKTAHLPNQPKRSTRNYWKSHANQRKFFDDLGKKIGIQNLDDWYDQLSNKLLRVSGGDNIVRRYNNSPASALIAAYPEHNWLPWKFNITPRGLLETVENQRKFFDSLGKELGIHKLDDWYPKLSFAVVAQNGGRALLTKHKGSPQAALMAAYPEHNWIPWKFNMVPHNFWKDPSNQRKFFDDLGKKVGLETLDDWYEKLSYNLVWQNGASGLMKHYRNLESALMNIYPEHKWISWKFKVATKGTWDTPERVRQYLADLSEKLSIQTLDDWYRVDWRLLNLHGATPLISKHKGLYNLLKEQYPYHAWDPKKFEFGGKKTQRWLFVTLKKMFPNEEILEDFTHPKIIFTTGRPMQLDVFIPSKNLAFEYQGKQHYHEIGIYNPTKHYQQRDEEKRTLCAANNIQVIEVPYWWNRTRESLQEIIDNSHLHTNIIQSEIKK